MIEKIKGAKGWAVRGFGPGTMYFDEKGYIKIAVHKATLLKAGHKPKNIVRVKIKGAP